MRRATSWACCCAPTSHPSNCCPRRATCKTVQKAIALARRPVSEVMVSPVPTVAPDTSLRRVAQVLLQTGLPGLPVTDAQGTLQGFISRTDILRAVAADPPLDLWVGPAPA
jgi:Predicted transcriptional regulator, contains C-terminal CBS domains